MGSCRPCPPITTPLHLPIIAAFLLRCFYSISWAHIDEILQDSKQHFDSYFLEYHLLKGFEDGARPMQEQGQPIHLPVTDLKTETSILINEDCRLLSVVLGVSLKSNRSECNSIIHSQPKVLWPSARHTNVNIHSNRAEFLWPPGCNHLIQSTWQMEACRQERALY